MKCYYWKLLLLPIVSFVFMCSSAPREKKVGIAGTKLEVRKDPVSRGHIHYETKPVAILSPGDTFEILKTDRDYDFFTFYKVKTKDKIKGYLFEGDTFKIIDKESDSLHMATKILKFTPANRDTNHQDQGSPR